MKKTVFILLASVNCLLIFKLSAQQANKLRKVTDKSKLDCEKCYFQSMEYSQGATATLNSIWLFQCRNGAWIRIKKAPKGVTSKENQEVGNDKHNKDCKFCEVQSLYYSEGAIYSFGTQLNICRNGNWVPYSKK